MRMRTLITITFLCAASALASDNWPHWRGPKKNGTAKGNPPLKWDEKSNIKWKVPLPGKGSSTPIIWDDKIFITTAVNTNRKAKPADIPKPDKQFTIKTTPPDTYYQFIVLCLDRNTGKTMWKRVAVEEVPHEGAHPTHSYAAGSPVTDGKNLYVSFGSRGVYSYDLKGELKWKKRLGLMRTRYGWGEASTPALYKDWLIVNWDHEGQSHIFALDAGTGNIRWKKKRDEPTSWATPMIVEHNGATQVIVPATNKASSYDLKTGKLLWQCGPLTVNAIPTPIVRGGIVYCMSGYRGSKAYAIPLDASGDISGTKQIRWQINKKTPYIASPLLMGHRLYFTASLAPILSCVDVQTGKVIYEKRLEQLGRLYSSPVSAAKRIYFTDCDGVTTVIQSGDQFKVLAVNRLDSPIDASPAIVGDEIYLRGHRCLYCIGEK